MYQTETLASLSSSRQLNSQWMDLKRILKDTKSLVGNYDYLTVICSLTIDPWHCSVYQKGTARNCLVILGI